MGLEVGRDGSAGVCLFIALHSKKITLAGWGPIPWKQSLPRKMLLGP